MTINEIKIKGYTEKDDVPLDELLNLYFDNDRIKSILKGANKVCAFTAYDHLKMIAVCVAWKSTFHPFCTYFSIFVHPVYCDYQLEERLLTLLSNQKEVQLPLQTAIWETSYNLKSFYEASGFNEIRRTYLPKLDLNQLDSNPCLLLEEDLKIISLKDISHSYLLNQLSILVKEIYENTHLVNPVGNHDLNKWKKMILSEDVIKQGSFIIFDEIKNEILAYSFLHNSDQNNIFEFGWCGVRDKKRKQLLQVLAYQQIKFAKEDGADFIVGEIDSTDEYAIEFLRFLPFSPSPTWITFQKVN
ncbi:hypothetical protein ACQKCU_09580 [Heyndrickxia sporothermodurans]